MFIRGDTSRNRLLKNKSDSSKMSKNLKKTTTISVIEVADIASEKSDLSSNDSETKLVLGAKDKTKSSCCTIVVKLLVSAVCGLVFGFVLQKARVFEPISIRNQMVFESFIMLKTFLSAVAGGQLCFIILSVVPPFKGKFEKAVEEYISCFTEKSLFTSGLGAFMLGIGMTLSGSCPAMVLVQIGSWVPNAIFTLLGCLTAALLYGMVAPFIQRLTRPKNPLKKQSLPETFKLPFFAIALPMTVLLGIVIFIIEWFWPWTKDADLISRSNPSSANVITAVSWPPYASGILLGITQIPLVLFVEDTLGGSSSYVTMVSQWVVTERLQKLFPYLANKRTGVGNWWQVFLVSGAVIGALLSAVSSTTLASSHGVQAHVGFFGGFMMIVGARFAAGCTSGHGLSGLGLLIWMSFVAVPFMFGGAIATGYAMKATGVLYVYVDSIGAI